MGKWKWNPKTKGSGIITCIPQSGRCPNKCKDCFFQSGRSYLEPLEENLPHIPPKELTKGRIVRVNDGNDSNVGRALVERVAQQFDDYFFNTAIPRDLENFSGPVVLTVNPAQYTDNQGWNWLTEIPPNLMFVRIRTNTWNISSTVKPAVNYYTKRNVPVVLTFMAYFERPKKHKGNYIYRKRTANSYWAITTKAWRRTMKLFEDNVLVHSCGKIEGEKGNTHCSHCGNCIREYYNTKERMRR